MAKKKKLAKIVDAVKEILGNGVKKKQLMKAKALKRFIAKMTTKQNDIKKALDAGGLKKDRQKELSRHIKTLDKQIKKATKILKDLES